MAREDPALLRRVGGFVIGRKGYGSVRYRQPVDVRRLVLDDIVRFDSIGTVEVYPEGVVHPKPPVGEGLNRPAEVTLLRVFKKDRDTGAVVRDPAALDKFVRRLKKATAEQGARFVGYEADEGAWTFVVEHFSKYGLCGDDDGYVNEWGVEIITVRRGCVWGVFCVCCMFPAWFSAVVFLCTTPLPHPPSPLFEPKNHSLVPKQINTRHLQGFRCE